jgi:hypothetical protein
MIWALIALQAAALRLPDTYAPDAHRRQLNNAYPSFGTDWVTQVPPGPAQRLRC